MNVNESQTTETASPPSEKPAFLIGVTGYMRMAPDSERLVAERLRYVLRFIRHGGEAPSSADNADSRPLADTLAELLIPDANDPVRETYRRMLAAWRGLRDSPILVVSALAPGADSIAAIVALEEGCEICAAMPFPSDLYRNATTFVKTGSAEGDELDEANGARQAEFDRLLKLVSPRNRFPVLLKSDHDLNQENRRPNKEERRKKFEYDLNHHDDAGKPLRHARYFAAGEYLASYCHLLVGIWDGTRDDNMVGTSAVVESRLAGPRRSLLQTTSHLTLPHGGPVLQLLVTKESEEHPTAPNDPPPSDDAEAPVGDRGLPPMRLLHPYIFEAPHETKTGEMIAPPKTRIGMVIAPEQHTNHSLQVSRLDTFFRIAENLEQFNSQSTPLWFQRDRQDEFRKRLRRGPDKNDPRSLANDEKFAETEFCRRLQEVSAPRCHASDATALASESAAVTLRFLFLVTLAAAGLLHVFAHWHPRPDHGKQATTKDHDAGHHAGDADDPSGESPDAGDHSEDAKNETPLANASPATGSDAPPAGHAEADCDEHHFSALRAAFGATAFGLAALALFWFAYRRSKKFGERREDARALSEGLRVQFYWNLAGLGRSVSANYMQRQRTELDWIRAAIRAVTFPYNWWSDQFDELSNELKVEALQAVRYGWIDDQLAYFRKSYADRNHSLHSWHKLGFLSALAGVFSLLAWWLAACFHEFCHWLETWYPCWLGFALVFVGLAALCRYLVRRREESDPARDEHDAHDDRHNWSALRANFQTPKRRSVASTPEKQGREPLGSYGWRCLETWVDALLAVMMKVISELMPVGEEPVRAPATFFDLFFRRCRDFRAMVWLSLAVASLALFLALAIANFFPHGPSAENLGIICGGVLLLSGALAVAWVEKNLDSEFGYQYNTMAGLFQHASRHMTHDLESLRERADELQSLDTDAERLEKQAEFDAEVDKIQKSLYQLGLEAMDENAEWLILHRARPLEPVMAG